jgi:hypothetical protein
LDRFFLSGLYGPHKSCTLDAHRQGYRHPVYQIFRKDHNSIVPHQGATSVTRTIKDTRKFKRQLAIHVSQVKQLRCSSIAKSNRSLL